MDRIVALCRRFPLFVDRLQKRQQGRAPVSVDDEYDVQDLLHAILKLHFDDVRPEEVTPSYAGNASRVAFFPRERIVVEAKMTRPNLGQRDVGNQLLIDVARYAQLPTVDTLICLVFDPGQKCGNPRTLENDVEATVGRLKVRAVVCPQGLKFATRHRPIEYETVHYRQLPFRPKMRSAAARDAGRRSFSLAL
ncbi:PD-(D/E)XK nuclease domain-containing protein [Rhodopseudomonas sp. RCAM05734]|uniref:PD-(D/E)XK nuclease domain-containing protein n=1 Tax=Rhodopseudomonas sp. RCAM05734 TaxID=3457549 RepID=UPI0040450110